MLLPKLVVQKLDGIKAALQRDDVRLVVHTGPPRRGKSVLGLTFARYIDPAFTADRVTFTSQDFKAACVVAPPGGAVGLDEAIKGGNARRAMSDENVGMMNWLAVWGHRNLYGYICYPKWSRLDPAIKDFVHHRIHHPVRGIAIWYDVFHPDHAKEPVQLQRFKFRFPDIPDGPFKQAYLAKKADFTKKESKAKRDHRSKVTEKQRRTMVWLVQKQGKTHDAVAKQFGVSRRYVGQLVAEAEA